MGREAKHSGGLLSNSTTKKVCVKRFGQNLLEGYVTPHAYLHRDGIEVLARSAEALFIPYNQVRCVYFVREFGRDPEQNQRKLFATRPKLGGLWVRMRFLDGEELEGVIPNDLRIMGKHGVTLTPPDSRGNTQRVFVPSDALENFVVMGVIGRPDRRPKGRSAKGGAAQIHLFSKGRGTARASN